MADAMEENFNPLVRIANAIEALLAHAKEDRELQMRNEEQKQALIIDDLQFRREQATKADAEKEAIMKMFMGGPQPQRGPVVANEAAQAHPQRRRPRHDHPEPPEAA